MGGTADPRRHRLRDRQVAPEVAGRGDALRGLRAERDTAAAQRQQAEVEL